MSYDLTSEVALQREQIRSLWARIDALEAALRGGSGDVTVPVHQHTGGGSGGPMSGARISTYLEFDEVATPGNPPSGRSRLYAKTDGRMYSKDDAGVESGPL